MKSQKTQAEKQAQDAKTNPLLASFPSPKIRLDVEFIRPMSDENARLVNQGGLFTRAPDGVDLESWVKAHSKDETGFILMKITIPNTNRIVCLRSLNRMNINHLTLFPDMYGASRHCNHAAQVKGY